MTVNIAVLLATGMCSCVSPERAMRGHTERADRLFKAGDYEAAAREARLARDISSNMLKKALEEALDAAKKENGQERRP